MENLRNKKSFICDMDGVIYHGEKILDGVHGVSVYSKGCEPVHYDFEKQTNSGVIDAFVDCVENGKEPKISGKSLLSSMNVILSAIEDAKK